jgi:hypothetical protein
MGAVGQYKAVTLENERLRAVILPRLGGRVWSLQDRVRDREWIWHRDGVELNAAEPGAEYDAVWAGGWEELFPNDAPGIFEGRQLPDHGEWWTLAFKASSTSDEDSARVRLTATSRIRRATCVKEFILPHDAASLTVSYSIQSLEQEPFHFLFKQHLPVLITPQCRLALPGGRVEAVDPSFGTVLNGPGPFDWPGEAAPGSGVADLRDIPAATQRAREFVYVRDVPHGWCGIDDLSKNASLRMRFDTGRLPYVWFFLSYGGWRDVYTAVLEPCTNLPKDLAQAVRAGQSARLMPDGVFTTTVDVHLGGVDA